MFSYSIMKKEKMGENGVVPVLGLPQFVAEIEQGFCFSCLEIDWREFFLIFRSWHEVWQTAGLGFSSGCDWLFDAAAMFSAVWLFSKSILVCLWIIPTHMLPYRHYESLVLLLLVEVYVPFLAANFKPCVWLQRRWQLKDAYHMQIHHLHTPD